MPVSFRSLALGFGLGVALVASSTAVAAALPKAPNLNPAKKRPGPPLTPSPALTGGLSGRASLGPRDLHDKGASMNIHRAVRVEATADKVVMDEHTQLWLHFRANKDTDYDVACQFSGRSSVLTMDYASGKYVRQQRSTLPANGRLTHKVFARSKTENIKVFMQASGDIDWRRCTVEPAR